MVGWAIRGVELLGKEMTRDLQAIKAAVENEPAGTTFDLVTKGVEFGTVTSTGIGNPAAITIDNGLGIDEDLAVRPFGRKGGNHTIRDFDRSAMPFHMGIQPVEVVGEGIDGDGDGITDELTVGTRRRNTGQTTFFRRRNTHAEHGAEHGTDHVFLFFLYRPPRFPRLDSPPQGFFDFFLEAGISQYIITIRCPTYLINQTGLQIGSK